MKERLHRRAIEDSKIEIIINKLKEQHLLDDTALPSSGKKTGRHSDPAVKANQVRVEKERVADDIIKEVTDESDDAQKRICSCSQ